MSGFSEMNTEQLKDTIEKEIKKADPDRNTVMECLQELKRLDPEETQDKVLEAWEASQQSRSRPAPRLWKRIAAAAAIVVLLLITAVPSVLGAENIFEWLGQWTKDIFSFGKLREGEFVFQTDHPGLQELYDTVTALGVEKNVVPTWLPDGYELEQIETLKRADNTTVFANFTDGEHQIMINIMISAKMPNTEYQKGGDKTKVLEEDGIKHYIVENNKTWTAAWIVDNTECSLSAYKEDHLHKMLSSIYDQEE